MLTSHSSKDFLRFADLVGSSFSQKSKAFAIEKSELCTWRSLVAVFYNYSVIVIATLFGVKLNHPAAYVFLILIIAARQHGLLILIHEAVHGLLSKNKKVNFFIADLFCALPLGVNLWGYRENHLAHHNYLNQEADPDWTRKKKSDWNFPTSKKKLAQLFLMEIFYQFPKGRFLRIWNFLFKVKHPMKYRILIYSFYLLSGVCIYQLNLGVEFVLYWIVPLWFFLPGIFLVRSIAEHFGLTYEHELNSSRNVEASFMNSIFIPHNAGYHLTHHLYPQVPFYHIKELTDFLTNSESYKELSSTNDGYLFGKKTLLMQVLKKS